MYSNDMNVMLDICQALALSFLSHRDKIEGMIRERFGELFSASCQPSANFRSVGFFGLLKRFLSLYGDVQELTLFYEVNILI
jgi:hypothetical protein